MLIADARQPSGAKSKAAADKKKARLEEAALSLFS